MFRTSRRYRWKNALLGLSAAHADGTPGCNSFYGVHTFNDVPFFRLPCRSGQRKSAVSPQEFTPTIAASPRHPSSGRTILVAAKKYFPKPLAGGITSTTFRPVDEFTTPSNLCEFSKSILITRSDWTDGGVFPCVHT